MITQQQLKQALHYDEFTGVFTWAARRSGVTPGARAGTNNGLGYIQVTVSGRAYVAHRLAWLYVHGEWPAAEIDHVNRDRSDNRIANLRLATRHQNVANTPTPKRNTSGFKGVNWHPQSARWRARITINGKRKSLGLYKSPTEAGNAYRIAALAEFGEFSEHAS